MKLSDKELWKKILPYAGMPLLCVIFALYQAARMEPIIILQFEVLCVFGYILSVGDIKAQKVPNGTVKLMLLAWLILNIPQLFFNIELGLERLKASALGFALAAAVFLTVYYVSKKGLGGGDVKFMAVAGLYLGYGGVMPAMLIGTMLAALVGLLLVALKRIRKTDSIPLIPFLYAGMLVTFFLL